MRERPLLLALCVFWLGIAFEDTKNLWLAVVFAIVCVYDLRPLKRRIGRGFVLLLIFILGTVHMHKNLVFREEYLSKLTDGEEITIWGEVYKQEYLDDTTARIYLTDCYVRFLNITSDDAADIRSTESESDYQETIPCNQVMVYTSSADYDVGAILKIKGQFHNFSTAANEGNFDSKDFYQSQKIDFYVDAEEIEKIDNVSSASAKWILRLKERVGQVYDKHLPDKWSGVMKGIVLGDKSKLDADLKKLFTTNGIVHILTVSGLHVSVLGRGFYRFLRSRRWGFFFSGIAAGIMLLGYGYLTGNGVSTQRAVGMMVLFMLAKLEGRSYDMLNSLGGMGIFLLWENPFLTGYSGLWFSVMALIGVGWPGTYLAEEEGITKDSKENVCKGITGRFRGNACKGIWMSVGVTLATLPIVAYCYYEVPLYSPLLNCIVIPLLTPVFVCGVLGGIAGLFSNGLGKVLLYPCRLILGLYELLCKWVGKLPFSSVITGQPPVWLMVVYYIVLGVGILWVKKYCEQMKLLQEGGSKASDKKVLMKLSKGLRMRKLFLTAVCTTLLLLYKEAREVEINFLDVGQGDGIHIAIGDHDFFIDGGSSSVECVGEYRILPYLRANDISKIEFWFISHTDTDHISGLLEVMDFGYPIENLMLSKAMPKDEKYMQLVDLAKAHGVNVCYMSSGDVICCEDVVFSCLYPGQTAIEDKNEASLILELSWDDKKALFTGDISSEVEALLIEQGVLSDVFLYKAAHHGSKYSNSTEFLEVILPEIAVVSCSSTNVYGHPSPDAIERLEACGAEVFYTMSGGQVTVKFDDEVEVCSWRN